MREATHAADLYPSRKQPQPEIVERKDPVVYNQQIVQNEINKNQLEFYDRNGYLFIENFLFPEELQEWGDELKQVWEQSKGQARSEVIKEPGGEEVRSVFAVHRDNELFKKAAQHPRLIAIVEQILGSRVYVHQSRINFKPGFTGKEFYWHSDFETWHVEDGMPRMRALSCSIALEDNFSYNGPLMVIPGSHKHFISCVGETPDNHFKESLRKQEYGVPDPESLKWLADQGGIEVPTGKAGSVVIFDCNTMHGSNSNITPMPRSNVFIVYNSVENKLEAPYSGQKPRPCYIAEREL
jgi:ectoine hydroxylase